jgi:hypothetical protein
VNWISRSQALLPGVTVHVLGPPSLKTETIRNACANQQF